jgi:hypothetical protein
MLLPFIIIQHAHFLSKHALACSWLQIEQIHPCWVMTRILLCCFDFSSAYTHNIIRGTPIAKNMSIVRIGTRKTTRAIPKHIVTIPRIDIQRVVVSINVCTPS